MVSINDGYMTLTMKLTQQILLKNILNSKMTFKLYPSEIFYISETPSSLIEEFLFCRGILLSRDFEIRWVSLFLILTERSFYPEINEIIYIDYIEY